MWMHAMRRAIHTWFALGEGLQERVTRVHARSDCVLTKEKRLRFVPMLSFNADPRATRKNKRRIQKTRGKIDTKKTLKPKKILQPFLHVTVTKCATLVCTCGMHACTKFHHCSPSFSMINDTEHLSSTDQICLNQAWYRDTPPSLWTPSTQTIKRSNSGLAVISARAPAGLPARATFLPQFRVLHPPSIIGQTAATFMSPLAPWRPMEDSSQCCLHALRRCFLHLPFLSLLMLKCYPQAFQVFDQMR